MITFDDAFKDVYQNALPVLKEYNFPAVVFVNASLVGKTAEFATRSEDRSREICSLDDLLALEAGGVTIANHGYNHRQLSGLPDDEVLSEYEKGRSWIASNFRKNAVPEAFVFPIR